MERLSLEIFRRALSTGLAPMASTAWCLGVCFHLGCIPFEMDNQGWRLIGCFYSAVVLLTYAYVTVAGFDVYESGKRAAVAGISFNAGVLTSISLYRLFSHQLRRFPGPILARLSRFYAMRLASKRKQLYVEVQELHRQHGDFVRVGPREISINRASAIPLIYGPPSRCQKSPWYSQVSTDVTEVSINSTRDMEVHRRRRRAWDRSFSSKALLNYEPRVKAKTDALISQLRAKQGKPVDATKWAMFFSFDVMGDVGLGKDFHTLDTGNEHPAIKGIHDSITAIGLLTPVPWLLAMLGAIPGAMGGYTEFMDYCSAQVDEKERTLNRAENPSDLISWLLKARYEGDQSAPPGKGALHEDARLIIIAGSDTTAAALATTLYYLATTPRVFKKLQRQLDAAFPHGDNEWGYAKTKQIAYLDAVINEALRLNPPAPGGLPRVTPPEGLRVDEVHIPGDTIVGVPAYTLQRDERYFERAGEFVPERWNEAGTGAETAAFMPFSRGAFNCAGKRLALMELRMVVSRVVPGFDLAVADSDAVNGFAAGQVDSFILISPPLPLRFLVRQA
ncbi:uncharacterized protein K452DRAFT_226565 [Aplosporella prunicola CBS 121167]|uniref:Cytochrome P450 n=1 Tax=Aplosporella prunicola CBS 121167 TaxID=1176127 RepID=A0A6A6BDQ1_9PEZI|nr:uncharacterized protein K452DRAFT_226565 [Aplosporella prunicola CBS 121167]KAF2142309.1 hypothetical protein K452DRAFT_226565 [Aplosporella prunicola CBS 121167]